MKIQYMANVCRQRRSHTALQTRELRQPSRVQSPCSEASATAAAEPECAAVKEEYEFPMTVTVTERRQKIAKRTGQKVQ